VSVVRQFGTDGGVIEWRFWLIWLVILCGFVLVQQAAVLDCLSFDPFLFQQDGVATAEVDVGRR
jgi:hypothetical protein